MKHLLAPITIALTAISLSMTAPASAAGLPKEKRAHHTMNATASSFSVDLLKTNNDQTIQLEIINTGGTSLTVTLKDPDGNDLDNFNISRDIHKTTRPFNFTGAAEGLYTLEVTDRVKKITRQVRLQRVVKVTIDTLSVE